MNTVPKKIARVALAIGAAVSLTMGCSCNPNDATNGDVTGVVSVPADKLRSFTNIDGHPNVAEFCIDNRAFLTTSRTAGNNFMRFPEDDIAYCGAKEASPYFPTIKTGADPAPTPAS